MHSPPDKTVFVSHTSKNNSFVDSLRHRLESREFTVLEDSQFGAGENLPDSVRDFIDRSATVIAVGSAEATGSHWVKRELRYASKQGKRIVPLMLPGSSATELREIFELPQPTSDDDLEDWPPELIGILVADGAGALDSLMPALLDALEGRGGGGQIDLGQRRAAVPLADLVLRLRATRFELVKNPQGKEVRRPVATASLAYFPPDATDPEVVSPEFTLVAPLGKIEADEMRFYLERYFILPYGNFAERARGIEQRLPLWGQDLWAALGWDEAGIDSDAHAAPVKAWKKQAAISDRRFTIQAPPARTLSHRATDAERAEHRTELEATTELLALPWELLHDDHSYLFHDGIGVRVRRSLPGGEEPAELPEAAHQPPLRVLAVCARPEDKHTSFIDHRVSIQPLTEALNALGELAEYEILTPPTFPELCDRLRAALQAGRPFHIVHFDGHGVFDKVNGLGALVFEHPDDSGKLHHRRAEIIDADRLGKELRHAGVGLFFLEACQSAQAEDNPEASVAGRLLQSGVASVVAMSHSVLVETARRFTAEFYPALAEGARVGAAMLRGQRHLERHRRRGWGWEPRGDEPGKMQRRPLELQDWFVPVLYQDGDDPVLLPVPPPVERVRQELEKDRALATGNVPLAPPHSFVGRSRLLLAAERLMLEAGKSYVVLRGEGGEGKTTLAAELSRWLVSTRRADRGAFASVENLPRDAARAVLVQWGTQLVADFSAKADSVEAGLNVLAAALSTRSVVLMLDNMESILPPPEDSAAAGARAADADVLQSIFDICARLLERAPQTRIIFTSREALPADSPFGDSAHLIDVGRLTSDEGMELVARVLAGSESNAGDATINAEALRAEKEDDIKALVTTVNAHARSLVLLAPELARRGLRATTEKISEIMSDLEARYPGERERSLFASLELSLRRLPAELRGKLAPLGVFHGGGFAQGCGIVAEWDIDNDEELLIGRSLQSVGLVEFVPLSVAYLRFEPALAPALLRELRDQGTGAEAAARTRWAIAYRSLARFLYKQQFKDAHLAAQLTLLELPNLLAALHAWFAVMEATACGTLSSINLPDATPESVIEFTTDLESLLANLGRREALVDAAAIRTRAADALAAQPDRGLTHEACLAAQASIERWLESGRFTEAVNAARELVELFEVTPQDAFPLLAGDHAVTLVTLGRALRMSGDAVAALDALTDARSRFEALATSMDDPDHRRTSAKMASGCLTEEGDCLRDLGQLDAAAEKYEEATSLDEERGDVRDVAAGKFQLGTVRMLQGNYTDALTAFGEARETFERLGEPRSVAAAWHQIGRVHQGVGQLEEAESAYVRSLSMEVQAGNTPGEATSRSQLGSLYNRMQGRQEDAVTFFLQAAEIFAEPEAVDPLNESKARSNAAGTLVDLGRYDEAREQVLRALECKASFGPNAKPWITWMILHSLEIAVGDRLAAALARAKAIATYADARRRDWQVTVGAGAQLCGLVRTILAAKDPATPPGAIPDELHENLPQFETQLREQLTGFIRDENTQPYLRALAPPLLAILDGSRDPTLADDPALDYDDAAELILLLEQL
ncbi:CHAT domain-containing protein [Stieleria varia]|uniref:CHAT domain protein n=1 Tax=Stieleria varia TaxID=2528005 RepID=A0A5C6ASH6_9BACT|nr:CHAT domain-containing protein [Stieleria varia]TWU03003.1 CHAT domain protein [Stieleria varia]